MGLLGARNAGIEVPDETIDRAIKYYVSMTGSNGQVGYSGGAGGGSDAVTSITVLVYAIARQKELPQYQQALTHLKGRSRDPQPAMEGYPTYTRYYRAQALFQGDVDASSRNSRNCRARTAASRASRAAAAAASVAQSIRRCRCCRWR